MTPELRVVSFGDLDGAVWGSMLDLGEPVVAFATPDGLATAPDATLTEHHGSWRLVGDGFELEIESEGDRDHTADELCRVSGTAAVAGHQRAIDCIGIRTDAAPDVPLSRLGSLRSLSGWFAADHGVTVLALRPAGVRGQEDDVIAATVFEPERWMAVDDPRVSTTYRAGGHPERASLELWIGEGDEQCLRRAAAEASGDGASVQRAGLRLRVTPLRCHTRGLDGAGVYVFAQLQ
jgi:hypothetical protein